jgi:hypothetical protein
VRVSGFMRDFPEASKFMGETYSERKTTIGLN